MDETNKTHLQNIVLLVMIALTIGIYLIATTVVISKDGVTYIERAQTISINIHKVMNSNQPFGLPVLIAAFHRVLFIGDSAESWVLSAQIGVLTCRIIAVAVLYLFGTLLVGGKQSLGAVLALIFLPYPAELGADVLREWPCLLFLFTGLLLLYKGIQKESCLYLFGAGLACGLGYMIRPECAQIMLFGLAFFFVKMLSAHRQKTSLRKNWVYLGLLAGFLVVFLPYITHLDNIIPSKLGSFYRKITWIQASDSSQILKPSVCSATAGSFESCGIFHAASNLIAGITENLMYYFAIPAAIGFYCLFFKSSRRLDDRRLLIGLFIGFYITILCMLDIGWGYISRRHVLPLSIMLCFYIPEGTRQIACYLNRKSPLNEAGLQRWSVILIAIGIVICLPKLLKPMGYDKKEYRKAAQWIAENTNKTDQIYTFDRRIPFYANRSCLLYTDPKYFKPDFKANYLVTQSKNNQIEVPIPPDLVLQKKLPLKSGNKTILIFKRTP